MAGYKALTVHVYAWVCAGDGLRLRPSGMRYAGACVRACVRVEWITVLSIRYSWQYDMIYGGLTAR